MKKLFLLYGVPWTGLLAALLFSRSIADDSERVGSWLLLGSALVFGLPHGAADFGLLRKMVSRKSGTSRRLGVLLALYALLAFLIAAFWYFFPGVSILGFLLLTALHFGSGDQIWESNSHRDFASSFLRGLSVIFAPLAFHPSESDAVLNAFSPRGEGFAIVDALILSSPVTLVASVTLLVFIDLIRSLRGGGFPSIKWLELGFLTAFFWILTPLYAVAVYFVAVHSWRHVFRLGVYAEKTGTGVFSVPVSDVLAEFYRKALPITAVSLAGLVLIYLVFKSDSTPLAAWTSAYLILLSALTVPHAILIGLTEKTLSES